jgi:hypothetical protein
MEYWVDQLTPSYERAFKSKQKSIETDAFDSRTAWRLTSNRFPCSPHSFSPQKTAL